MIYKKFIFRLISTLLAAQCLSLFTYLEPVFSQSILPAEALFKDETPKPALKDESVRAKRSPPERSLSEMEAELGRARLIRYKQERWNEMRRRLEVGEELVPVTEKPAPVVERRILPRPPPAGPGLNIILPYESGLAISGRKVIDFKLSNTIYASPDSGKGRVNQTNFELNQQLQVRVKGTVGRKVTVNVDFDDTRDDKRDISVVYKGDPDEILQEVAFGDITISLPSTEFVGYSKAVFGARGEMIFRPRTGFAKLFPSALWHRWTPKSVRLFMIGSRTKGITQTKRFTGNFILQRKEINDISYPRRQFYQLAFSTGPAPGQTEHRPIQVGSEKIFIDDQVSTNNNVDESTRTYTILETNMTKLDGFTSTPTVQNSFPGPKGEKTGVFKMLVPGVDYTVDYTKGVVRFKRIINLKDIIVADYKSAGASLPLSQIGVGVPNDPLFQPPNPPIPDPQLQGYKPILLKPDESLLFATREMKNFYVLGDTKIQRDDGRGNFILRINDLQNNPAASIDGLDAPGTSPQTKNVPKYPNDIDVDFENGIINFVSSDSFHSPFVRPFTDDIYVFGGVVPSAKNRYKIFAEYRFRKGNFSLDQTNIVSQSEQVFVDGKRMTRDVDYFIDYDAGIVSFFRPDNIRADSIVEITYDFAPFGGSGEETLVGMRSEWYLTDNFFFGQSVLLNFSPQPSSTPDLRSTAKNITVLEGDINWKKIKFGKFPIEITGVSAEAAQSIKNPNTSNKATVETFEGIRVEDTANLNKDSWQPAANPTAAGGNGYATLTQGGLGLFLSNENFKITDINPKAVIETSDQVQTLKMDYNLPASSSTSIVQVLNRVGVDMFTQRRQNAELWIHGDNSGARIQMRLGGIREQSDSSNLSTPKTEDKDFNGSLSTGEDVGYDFINLDGSTILIGKGNGRLDTQDLDGDGQLDDDDGLGNFSSEIGLAANPLIEAGNLTAHSTVDWSGWKIFQIPLNIGSSDQNQWSSIKHVRLTVSNLSAASKSGTLRFGRISIVGTRFDTVAVSTTAITAQAFAHNNQDNPDYPSLVSHQVFQDLYDLENKGIKRREQGLAIQYRRNTATLSNSTVTVKEVFTKALNLSEHKRLKFFAYGADPDLRNELLLRVGNSNNYFEFRAKIPFNEWKLFDIDILDTNRDGIPDNGVGPLGDIKFQTVVGNPSLRNVTEIVYGLIIADGGIESTSKTLYFNEVHLTESLKITGQAYRAKIDFNWPAWGTWGTSWRFVDRDFQTLTSVGSGVDSTSNSGYLTLKRLKFLPLSSAYSYDKTETPRIQNLNDPNILVSILSEGKDIINKQNISGDILLTQLPLIPQSIRGKLLNVNFSGDHSLTIRNAISDKVDKRYIIPSFNVTSLLGEREDETHNYRFGTSYSLPWQPDILPGKFFIFKPFPQNASFSFGQTNSFTRLKSDNTIARSIGESYSFRTAFQFFPQLSLSPAYSLTQSFEERSKLDISSGVAADFEKSLGSYKKNLTQDVSLAGSLRLTSWFSPSFNYKINTAETYKVTEVIFGTHTFKPGEIKDITRSASGDISASLAPKDIFQRIPYVRWINPAINSLSFSGGYSISDGDAYQNLGGGFDTRYKFFIRDNSFNLTNENPNAIPKRTSLTASDTSRLSGRWTPFEGFKFLKNKRWAPLKNLNGSGTFTETKTSKDTTGTLSKSYSKVWPDFVFSTSEIDRPLFISRWITDTRANGTYQERLTETLGQTQSAGKSFTSGITFTAFRLLQFSVSYNDSVTEDTNLQTQQLTSRTRSKGINGQVVTTLKWGNWRFTPNYTQSQSESENGVGKKTSDVINRSGSLQIFGDINLPRFFRLPFGKQLSLSNRLILNSSLRYGSVRDAVDDVKSVDNFDFNFSGDFEITPNIRTAFGGGYSRTMNKTKKENDFQTYSFTSRVTIQF